MSNYTEDLKYIAMRTTEKSLASELSDGEIKEYYSNRFYYYIAKANERRQEILFSQREVRYRKKADGCVEALKSRFQPNRETPAPIKNLRGKPLKLRVYDFVA